MASIKVAVRVRPPNKREKDMGCSGIIKMENDTTFITNVKLPTSCSDSLGRERIKQFTYDHSYWSCSREDPDYSSQEKIYNDLGDDVVKAAYQGYNACVFAYGQTGSGKTYTMMGAPEDCGLIPRICESLFMEMEETDVTYKTEVSYLEIYNERVRDLLREKKQTQLNLRVREHPKDGPYVQDLSRHLVLNYTDVEELIARGNFNRTTAATNMNDHSSRSHAIFTIFFTQAKYVDSEPNEISSKIHLVDLAGSERADSAGTKGDRLKEGGSINKSLVTLGNVISALADLTDRGATSQRGLFIPYRDSVITWLLKDSLGGNAKTIMIATITPADCHYAETLSTLRYANRAKRIINKPMVNEDPNVKLIRELRAENARLRSLLGQNVNSSTNKAKLSRNEAKVSQLTAKWADKWQETATVLQEHKTLALRKEGMGVVLDSDLPYLLAIDDNILTTGMKLYHLQEGDTRVGREDAGSQDIVLCGPQIEAEHCIFHHSNVEVQLIPLEGARCSVNNNRIHEATKLSQGAIIRLGKRHTFRFNHPGEAAKLREEMNAEGTEQLIQVWKDFQWSWSNQSINDSALGSDLELEPRELSFFDEEKLEERRRQIESLEHEHCLAEAQRLSREVEQEGKACELLQKEEDLHNLSLKADSMRQKAEEAHYEIRRLTAAFEEQFGDELVQQRRLQTEEERLLAEEKRIKDEQDKLERDKERAREERRRLREQRAKEREELLLAQEQQQEEWEEIKGERRHLQKTRRQQQKEVEKQKAKLESKREEEHKIYENEMAKMRDFVNQEVQDMRVQAGFPEDPKLEVNGHVHSDEELDLSEFKLNLGSPTLSPREEGPVLPMQYLEQSEGAEDMADAAPVVLEELTAGTANEKLDHLASQVEDIHVQVCEALHRKYNSVLSCDDTTGGLTDHVITQFANLKPAFEQLGKLAESHSLSKSGVTRLQDYDRQLGTVDRFLQVHSGLQATHRCVRTKHFTQAVKHLEGLQGELATLEAEDETELNVHKVLTTEACIQRERLLYELGETWNVLFRWTMPLESRRLMSRPRTVTLEVGEADQSHPLVNCTANAMQSTGLLDSRLRTLTDRIMQNLVEPAVQDRNTLLQLVDETDKCVLCVVRQPDSGTHKVAVPPVEAFQKLEQIFVFLHQPIADITVSSKIPDKTLSRNHASKVVIDENVAPVHLAEKLGQIMCKPLFQCVYNDCLSHSIPKNSCQFDRFNEIVQLTEEFQEMLSRLGFLAPNQSTLMDYLNNVNSLFANIKSQEILRQAHQFMTQELLHSIQISSEHPLGTPGKGAVTHEKQMFVNICRDRAGTSNYKLPTCQISIPVSSLMCLSYGTLEEAMSTSQEGALTLCHSLRNMFELYCDVVPSYHKEKLNTMALLAALHHNNCMFVAHHLITLDKCFAAKLSTLDPGRDPQLAELVSQLRKLGNECFTCHIDVKIKQLEDHLAAAEGFSCIADDEGAGAKNAIRLMLNHLQHISSIWKSVLPTNVFFKAVGTLLNAALNEILDSVLAIEEFSAEDCEYLHDVLAKITTVSPELFRVEEVKANPQVALHEHVTLWMKFRELVIVLKSSMQDVSDRWSDGKGPLALYFTAEEVQKLVVAMFENTSKRDSLLSQLR